MSQDPPPSSLQVESYPPVPNAQGRDHYPAQDAENGPQHAEPENMNELVDVALSTGKSPANSRIPVVVTCPHCRETKQTRTAYRSSEVAWKSCLLLCLCCWCCPLVMFCPFCCNMCKDVVHKCSACGKEVGRFKLTSLAK